MKEIVTTKYQCERCLAIYPSADEAKTCQKRKVKGKRPDIGETILILKGEFKGQHAKVYKVFVNSLWHGGSKKYWHTVGVLAKIIDQESTVRLYWNEYDRTE